MFTIIGADGKEYGPVATAKVQEWIAGGRANLQTRARRANETEWKTLGDFPEFAPATVPPVMAGSTAAAPSVAAAATPAAMPADGALVTGDARTIAADLIARAAPLDVFDCLGRSWHLWTANFLPLVGVTLLVTLVQVVIGFIPILGAIAGVFLKGVFYGGLYYYYLGKLRGEPREVGDAFAGFSRAFGPLALASFLVTIITLAVAAIFIGPWLIGLIATIAAGHGSLPALPGGMMLLGMLAAVMVVIFLQVSWSFAFALVIDKGLGAWTAMEVSRRVIMNQWFRVFFVLFLGVILTMLGLVGFIIGIFFTLPLMIGALVYAYNDLCHFPAASVSAPAAAPAATPTPQPGP
jgi:hypothetical protein